jgi:hypothetical protein
MYVGNFEFEVEGHADVDDGATGIEAMGCWFTQGMGGCTSSEKGEKRKGRDETHVAVGRREKSLHTKV